MSNDKPTPTSVAVRRGSRVVPVQSDEESEDHSRIPWFEGSVDTWEPRISAPPPVPAAAGPALRGKERLRDEGEIARGGMGSIRRLYDNELLRHIAMKVLDGELAANPESKERFLDEARINGLLDHPNIVPVHELVLDARGVPSYFTMKLVERTRRSRASSPRRRRGATSNGSSRSSSRCATRWRSRTAAASFTATSSPTTSWSASFGQVYVMDWGCAHVMRRSIARRCAPPDRRGNR